MEIIILLFQSHAVLCVPSLALLDQLRQVGSASGTSYEGMLKQSSGRQSSIGIALQAERDKFLERRAEFTIQCRWRELGD